jgi:gliding motility-associated-like protein
MRASHLFVWTTLSSMPTLAEAQVRFGARYEAGCEEVTAYFQDSTEQVASRLWEFYGAVESSSTQEAPVLEIPYGAELQVRLTITDQAGNVAFRQDTIEASTALAQIGANAPNVFTPNGDGRNDVFTAIESPYLGPCTQLSVFDRAGHRIFLSQGNNATWDGRTFAGEQVDEGTYFYVLLFGGAELAGSVFLSR